MFTIQLLFTIVVKDTAGPVSHAPGRHIECVSHVLLQYFHVITLYYTNTRTTGSAAAAAELIGVRIYIHGGAVHLYGTTIGGGGAPCTVE